MEGWAVNGHDTRVFILLGAELGGRVRVYSYTL